MTSGFTEFEHFKRPRILLFAVLLTLLVCVICSLMTGGSTPSHSEASTAFSPLAMGAAVPFFPKDRLPREQVDKQSQRIELPPGSSITVDMENVALRKALVLRGLSVRPT